MFTATCTHLASQVCPEADLIDRSLKGAEYGQPIIKIEAKMSSILQQ